MLFNHPHITSLNSLPQKKEKNKDREIVNKIKELTSVDSTIWTAPKYDRSHNVHRFFQYPAMMVPIVQQRLIEILISTDSNIKTMLDPFMGSSTSIVAGMMNGLSCYGQDINPLSILLSKIKTNIYDLDVLSLSVQDLLKNINEDEQTQIERNFKGIDKWFKPTVSFELSKIVRSIRKCKNIEIRRFFWITLAETVRLSSNDRTSTFKLHIRTLEDIQQRNISPIDLFEKLLSRNLEDLKIHIEKLKVRKLIIKGKYKKRIYLKFLDSSQNINIPKGGVELLVSSPPYGDNATTVPYGQHSYLPLNWIDLKDIDDNILDDFLSTISAIDKKSLGGSLVLPNEEIIDDLFSASPSFKNIISQLSTTNPDKTAKIICFTHDLDTVLNRCVDAVKKNGYFIWTIGNRRVGGLEIPNNKILIELLEHKGIKLIYELKREILNKRMAQRNRSTSTMSIEDILIFRKTI